MTRSRAVRKSRQQANIPLNKKKEQSPLITLDHLVELQPLTENQEKLFDAYDEGKNIIAHGYPGVGKTLCLLYKALEEVLDPKTPYKKVIVVRSTVATRDIGFLPGSISEKISEFEVPYKYMIKNLFDYDSDEQYEMLYGNLKAQKSFYFMSTSFIRGCTFDECIMIVDEFSNLSFHELDSIITRVGEDCKIHFSGDIAQSDLTKSSERSGTPTFLKILQEMEEFERIDFNIDDIVRSGTVKNYIIAKNKLGLFSNPS
jgi:phosphate starvation-inducible PhoH-like protein